MSGTLIRNARIVSGETTLEQGVLLIEKDRIAFVGHEEEFADWKTERQAVPDVAVDAQGGWIVPGFIDIHVHGGFGHDFMNANREAYDAITRFHARNGTTGMLATTVTASKEAIDNVLAAAHSYRAGSMPGAALLGVHLEGPFISPAFPGAQNPSFIVSPNLEWLQDWTSRYPDLIRIVTLAPEREGARKVIRFLRENGIAASCGHTNATYDEIQAGIACGLCHAVHTFNAMRAVHHREPGTAGAVLSDDRITAEVIADGHHVHPACIRALHRAKPKDGFILITDAMAASGLGNGTYDLGGLAVEVDGGVARLKEGGALAGSTLTMIDAFRYAVREVGLTVPEASRAASANPAKRLGLEAVTGTIEQGKQADVLLLTPDLALQRIWIRGTEFMI